MKVALYYPWIYLKSGAERTILETAKRSQHEIIIFTNHFDKTSTFKEFKNYDVRELKRVPVERDLFSVIKASFIILTQKINLNEFDLLLVHSDGLADLITVRNKKLPVYCFCHSPLRPVFDEYYKKHFLKSSTNSQKLIFWFFENLFKFLDRVLWKNYKHIYFTSRETFRRAKIGKILTSLNTYTILHPGIDYNNFQFTNKSQKYFVVPGRIMWAKNIELAIEAFKKFQNSKIPKLKNYKLIIAGQVDKKSKIYLKKLKKMAIGRKDIIFRTSSNIKNAIAKSYAAIFPSFNEDWGILPIEVNALGKPVIAVNRGGFVESQVHGETGLLVQPNAQSIANAMINFAKYPEKVKKMGINAGVNAKRYDWTKFISKFDKSLNEIEI